VVYERWEDGFFFFIFRVFFSEFGFGVRVNILFLVFSWDSRVFRISIFISRCFIVGTLAIVAMSLLARVLFVWLARVSFSRWFIRIIRFGYAI